MQEISKSNKWYDPSHYVVDMKPHYDHIRNYYGDLVSTESHQASLSVRTFFVLVYHVLGYHSYYSISSYFERVHGIDEEIASDFLDYTSDYLRKVIIDIYDDHIWMSDVRFYINPAYDDIFLWVYTYPAEYSRSKLEVFPYFLYTRI